MKKSHHFQKELAMQKEYLIETRAVADEKEPC